MTMMTEIVKTTKEYENYIEVLGVTVQLIFAASNNNEVPVLVREVLKSSYSNRKTA